MEGGVWVREVGVGVFFGQTCGGELLGWGVGLFWDWPFWPCKAKECVEEGFGQRLNQREYSGSLRKDFLSKPAF